MARTEITSCNQNWLSYVTKQVDFYGRANNRARTEPDFPWGLVDSRWKICRRGAKRALIAIGLRHDLPAAEWLARNADQLWSSRSLFADDMSRLLFDAVLVLRLTGHRQFFFPRTEFDDLVEIVGQEPFLTPGFPHDYLGVSLKVYDVHLREDSSSPLLKMVTSEDDPLLLNSYRQYLLRRDSVEVSPGKGGVVVDCGACIGETSLLFAGLVGDRGEVHAFDPMPLHGRFCRLQASLNPSLAHVFYVNDLAVGNRTFRKEAESGDSVRISPGETDTSAFSTTTLDDYASENLSRVDMVKMDVEGAEMDAIDGAERVIREHKPRLAISAYHKPEDLWDIPFKLKALNPGYNLYFGHHSPVWWESVVYAVEP